MSLPESASPTESKQRTSIKRRREEGFDKFMNMFQASVDKQEKYFQDQSTKNEALIAEHHRANEESRMGREEARAMRDEMRLAREAQERTSTALLDILRQGLL